LSASVAQGISVASWKTKPIAPRRSSMSPRRAISPRVGTPSPAISRSSVDLPQPDGPSSPTNSPSAMSRSMRPSATVPLR
jgi:hypothetical protein